MIDRTRMTVWISPVTLINSGYGLIDGMTWCKLEKKRHDRTGRTTEIRENPTGNGRIALYATNGYVVPH